MKRGILTLFLALFCLWFPSAYKRWTHSFRLAKCLIEWPYVPSWECEPISEDQFQQITTILEKPFSYLGKGAQCYAFQSSDKKFVLKLFRFDSCRICLGQYLLRKARAWLGMRPKHFLPLHTTIQKNFTSYQLACTRAQKQTGVVFTHLNPQKGGLPTLTIIDRLGRKYQINPTRYRFVLQKKIAPLLETFADERRDKKSLVLSYLTLIDELAEMGLHNLDPKIGRNFGFLDNRAMLIDAGDLVYSPQEAATDRERFKNQFARWIDKEFPNRLLTNHL